MKNFLKQVIGVFIAIFLIVLPIKTMFAPNDVAGAGVGGIAIILNYLFNFDMALVSLAINGVLLFIGLATLGKYFFIKTVYGAFLFPILMGLIPEVAITNDVLLAVLFGSLLTAVGVNILYYLDASSGGTTIPPLILKKYKGLNQSIGLLVTDAIVVLLSLFALGIESFMYSALVIILTAIIMETLSNGLSRKKLVYIMSKEYKAISQDLFNVIGRGATNLQAKGAYTDKDKQVLMIVLNDRDYHTLQAIIDKHDPKAFVIVQSVAKVTGDAFTYHSVTR